MTCPKCGYDGAVAKDVAWDAAAAALRGGQASLAPLLDVAAAACAIVNDGRQNLHTGAEPVMVAVRLDRLEALRAALLAAAVLTKNAGGA
jgi:hypothetical protein